MDHLLWKGTGRSRLSKMKNIRGERTGTSLDAHFLIFNYIFFIDITSLVLVNCFILVPRIERYDNCCCTEFELCQASLSIMIAVSVLNLNYTSNR